MRRCVYPHGRPSHAGVNGQRALTRGADALHDHAQNAPPTLLGLTNQAVIQVHLPERPQDESSGKRNEFILFLLRYNTSSQLTLGNKLTCRTLQYVWQCRITPSFIHPSSSQRGQKHSSKQTDGTLVTLHLYLELSSRSNVGTSSSCLVTMPNEALTATESEPLMLNPTSLIRWFPNRPLRARSDLSS